MSQGRPALPAKVLERTRLRAAAYLEAGWEPIQIARRLGVSRHTVSHWRRVWRAEGADGLKARPNLGAPRRLTDEQVAEICLECACRLMTAKLLGEWIAAKYGVTYCRSRIHHLAREHGWKLAGRQ